MSLDMKARAKSLQSFLKVFSLLGISSSLSFKYHPLERVAPLPLLILLSVMSTHAFSSLDVPIYVKIGFHGEDPLVGILLFSGEIFGLSSRQLFLQFPCISRFLIVKADHPDLLRFRFPCNL